MPDRYGFQLITGDHVFYAPDEHTRRPAVVLAVHDDDRYYITVAVRRSQGAPFVLGDDGSIEFIDLTAPTGEHETLIVDGADLEFRGDWAADEDSESDSDTDNRSVGGS